MEEGLGVRYGALKDSLSSWGPLTNGEMLTDEGYFALNALPEPEGTRLAYARYDGRSDTQVRLLNPVTGESLKLTRSNGISSFDWMPGGDLLFSQSEYADPYRVWGDLFRVGPDGIEVRITRDQLVTKQWQSRDPAVPTGWSSSISWTEASAPWLILIPRSIGPTRSGPRMASGLRPPAGPPGPTTTWCFWMWKGRRSTGSPETVPSIPLLPGARMAVG